MTDAKLSLADKDFGYPVRSGSVGPDVIDIRKLYANTGAFTYDPGFTSTASCQSKLTYICLLYTSPSPRDRQKSRMPSSA